MIKITRYMVLTRDCSKYYSKDKHLHPFKKLDHGNPMIYTSMFKALSALKSAGMDQSKYAIIPVDMLFELPEFNNADGDD